ncbi:MAG: energy-coupling factor transporter transmembrane component T [Lachnospiraceae bacterium]
MCLEKLHPLVCLIYFILGIVIAAASFNPVIGAINLVTALAAMITRKNYKNVKITFLIAVPTSIFLLVVQPLFSHNGVTPLFYINDMAVTLETVIFGAVALILLTGAVAWFLLMGDIFNREKLMYLFGRITPGFALLFSMTLGLIPQLKRRYDQIVQARVFLNAQGSSMRERVTRIATLTEWSLESSMETARSMEARGYGTGRRTSFHMFCFRKEDGIMLAVILVQGIMMVIAIFNRLLYVSFFPQIIMESVVKPDAMQIILYGIYAVFCIICIIPPKKKKGGRKNG